MDRAVFQSSTFTKQINMVDLVVIVLKTIGDIQSCYKYFDGDGIVKKGGR